MNCKPGDLAVMCRGDVEPENVGIIVRVLQCELTDPVLWSFEDASRPVTVWAPGGKEMRVRSTIGSGGLAALLDRQLRPLRDNDGDDETLAWAGKPEQVTA